MRKGMIRFVFALLAASVMVGTTPQPSHAVWRMFLNEHFNRDQHIRENWWAWFSPAGQINQRWHYNPWTQNAVYHYRGEPVAQNLLSRTTWGVVDLIYNRYVLQDEEFHQSLWSSFTLEDPNATRDVSEDPYRTDQNAWVWWGPFHIPNDSAAKVTCWMYIDIGVGMSDSVTFMVRQSQNSPRPIAPGNQAAFRSAGLFGVWKYTFFDPVQGDSVATYLSSYGRPFFDWTYFEYDLDSLRQVNEAGNVVDTVSVVGQSNLWVCWIFHSNAWNTRGQGAFLDDVIVSANDGLPDIATRGTQFGHVDHDSLVWNSNPPRAGEPTFFGCRYGLDGSGTYGPYNVRCLLDSVEIFSDSLTEHSDPFRHFFVGTDTAWIATEGQHRVRWELDTPIETAGVLRETSENNNVVEYPFEVTWNPPPTIELWSPGQDTSIEASVRNFRMNYTVFDSNATDTMLTIFFYWTADTTGLADQPLKAYEYNYIAGYFNRPQGEGFGVWDLWNDYRRQTIVDDSTTYLYLVALVADGYGDNTGTSVALGKFRVMPPNDVRLESPGVPSQLSLSSLYPNPFNRGTVIDYSLPTRGDVDLSVFDLTGRKVATLVHEVSNAGKYSVNWSPVGIGAGVYLVRIENAGQSLTRKAIYTP